MGLAIDVIQHKKTFGSTSYPTADSALIDQVQPAVSAPRWPVNYAPATTAGLTLGYSGGQMLVDGVLTTIADGTIALTASQTNYVEMTRAGVVSANITAFTAGRIPLYTAVTSGAAITTLTDVRAINQPTYNRLALATTGGTTALSYLQVRVQSIDITGALVSNATIEVPAAAWEWAINNGTTGVYTVTVKVSGQSGVTIPQGERRKCVCDGTDVRALTGYVATDGDTMTGILTLSADPTAALHAVTKQYADALVVGLLDDRGNYNASGNVWPSSGGSGTAGAILKGDLWYISVAGTLGGVAVDVGDTIRALVDTPGSTATNWDIISVAGAYIIPGAITASGLTQATAKMLGRSTASTGAIEEIAIGDGLVLESGTLSTRVAQNSKSAAYTTVLADAGKHIYHPAADTTARIWTIDSNANVAYPIGTVITFDNDIGAGVITIAITADTLVLVGPVGSTGSRTLASGGQATAIKVASTRWRINGTGLT